MAKTRVFIVDDSLLIRRILTMSLSEMPDFEVVGQAANGKLAVPQILASSPHVVVMDVEMPEMDGVATVKELRKAAFKAPIIMFSTVTSKASKGTMDALLAGANGYVQKPNQGQNAQEAIAEIRSNLVPKIRSLLGATK